MEASDGSHRLVLVPVSGWIAILVASLVGGVAAGGLGGAAVGATLGGISLGVSVLMASGSESLSGRRQPPPWLSRAVIGLLVLLGAIAVAIIVDAVETKGHISVGLWIVMVVLSLADGALATYGWLQM